MSAFTHKNVITEGSTEDFEKKKKNNRHRKQPLYTNVCVLDSLQLLSLSLIVAKEVSILTGVDVFMNLQQEPLAELKCLMRGLSLNKFNKKHHAACLCKYNKYVM